MASKSFNTSQIVNSSFSIPTLTTAQFSDVFPGSDEASGTPFSFARVTYSWTGVTGGDGTSALRMGASILTSNAPTVPVNGSAQVPLPSRIGSAAVAYSSSVSQSIGLSLTGPAAGQEYCDVLCMAGGATGAVCPFPKYWAMRFSLTGTTYGAGTLTIVSVTLFG